MPSAIISPRPLCRGQPLPDSALSAISPASCRRGSALHLLAADQHVLAGARAEAREAILDWIIAHFKQRSDGEKVGTALYEFAESLETKGHNQHGNEAEAIPAPPAHQTRFREACRELFCRALAETRYRSQVEDREDFCLAHGIVCPGVIPSVAECLKTLESQNDYERNRAAELLARMGARAAPAEMYSEVMHNSCKFNCMYSSFTLVVNPWKSASSASSAFHSPVPGRLNPRSVIMPKLSRWFIKTGLVYFVASLLLSLLQKVGAAGESWPGLSAFTPLFYHWLMLGWITQIIIGVSWWMFPRRDRERPRGSEQVGWIIYGALNGGLLLRALSEPFVVRGTDPLLSGLTLLAALAQWLAGALYVAQIWPRVKVK